MIVKKVLNNSLIFALDDQGKEVILMGKGIGYHLSTGSVIEKQDIGKVFILKEENIAKNIIQLAASTDEVYFDITKQIIDHAIEMYHMQLSDYIYLALTDHISYAVQRAKEGIQLDSYCPNEIKKFNPNEFEIGKFALKLVNEKFHIQLSDDEAATIALHFVNAQPNDPYKEQRELISKVVNNILNIIQYHFSIIYDKESIDYIRAVTHLQLFVQRLIKKEMLPDEKNEFLYRHIMMTCQAESECVKKINIYIKKKFHTDITNQEEMYLVLHIHRLIDNIDRKMGAVACA